MKFRILDAPQTTRRLQKSSEITSCDQDGHKNSNDGAVYQGHVRVNGDDLFSDIVVCKEM